VADTSSNDRALIEGTGAELYEAALAEGGIANGDPRIAKKGTHRDAFDLLVSLGLLFHDEAGERWIAQDPSAVQSRVVAPMSVEGARLLEESSQWARTFATLAHVWRRAPQSDERGPFSYLRGYGIRDFIAGLMAECESELLTAQPQSGRDTEGLQSAIEQERSLRERGVKVQTLYQHSARRSTATRDYVAAVTALGAEVRTLDEFFNRMIIVDRRVAIIPSPDDLGVALAIREPTVIAFLVDVFQRSWERAKPFRQRGDEAKQIADEQRSMTLRMLIEGHSDPGAAKRLGVSPRTYAGYIADLKEEFEAETRFQLGYEIGRKGISGDED